MATTAPRRRHAACASDSVSRPGTKNTWPGDAAGHEPPSAGRGTEGTGRTGRLESRTGGAGGARGRDGAEVGRGRWLGAGPGPKVGGPAEGPPHALTRQRRGEAEGVVAVARAVAGPVGADAGPAGAAARGSRGEDGVTHRALEQPARVTPVQPLGPRCGRKGAPQNSQTRPRAARRPRPPRAHPGTAGRRWPGARPAPRTPASPRSS